MRCVANISKQYFPDGIKNTAQYSCNSNEENNEINSDEHVDKLFSASKLSDNVVNIDVGIQDGVLKLTKGKEKTEDNAGRGKTVHVNEDGFKLAHEAVARALQLVTARDIRMGTIIRASRHTVSRIREKYGVGKGKVVMRQGNNNISQQRKKRKQTSDDAGKANEQTLTPYAGKATSQTQTSEEIQRDTVVDVPILTPQRGTTIGRNMDVSAGATHDMRADHTTLDGELEQSLQPDTDDSALGGIRVVEVGDDHESFFSDLSDIDGNENFNANGFGHDTTEETNWIWKWQEEHSSWPVATQPDTQPDFGDVHLTIPGAEVENETRFGGTH